MPATADQGHYTQDLAVFHLCPEGDNSHCVGSLPRVSTMWYVVTNFGIRCALVATQGP